MKPLLLAALLCLLPPALLAAPRAKVYARTRQPGEAMLIVVTGEGAGRAPSGSWAGSTLPFYACTPTTYLALAGIDLETSTGTARLDLTLRDASGSEKPWNETFRVAPKEFTTRRLEVPAEYVKPGPELEARADREMKRVKALYTETTPELRMRGRFVMPVKGAKTTSRFGERSIFNGEPRSPHSGADIQASTGTPVLAPQSGRVVLADDLFFPGRAVILDHGLGVYSLFGHLSEIKVREGASVRRGEVVGFAGATGRVTGPHLHWAVKVLGARVDPQSVMALPLDRVLGSCSQKRTTR